MTCWTSRSGSRLVFDKLTDALSKLFCICLTTLRVPCFLLTFFFGGVLLLLLGGGCKRANAYISRTSIYNIVGRAREMDESWHDGSDGSWAASLLRKGKRGQEKKKHGKGGKKKRKKNPRISRHGWITDPFISPLFCFPLLLLLQSSIYLPHSMAKG